MEHMLSKRECGCQHNMASEGRVKENQRLRKRGTMLTAIN